MLRCSGEYDFIRAAIRVTFAVLAAITRMLTMIPSDRKRACAVRYKSTQRIELR
ncbi:hypothetical protein ANAPRD1_00801 [Anaplasma phagocytophilum]|nr:hypothetical protein ANAPRD1_00801 [Anaplasma phagocytophilum]SCV66300.1 hypothetical protein ANAPH2_01546 [Anaplasma phagocytophilum]